MFLSAFDSQQYRPEITRFLQALLANQRLDGSWSYTNAGEMSGDTSQTQYGAMAAWIALKSAELSVEPAVYENALRWLIEKQSADGSFAYKPDSVGERHTSISLTAAGAASALICADALGLLDEPRKATPDGLQRVETGSPKPAAAKPGVAPTKVMKAVDRANDYFKSNFSWKQTHSFYYFMYAMERYMTFRDVAAGNRDARFGEDGAVWYDQGVELLQKQQAADGSYSSINGKPVATSFAILFLMRSTRSAIPMEGLLGGNQGLPERVDLLTERPGGGVIIPKTKLDVDELIRLLDEGGEIDLSAYRDPKMKRIDARRRDPEMERIRRELASPDFARRMLAVKVIAADGQLDSVAGLIYALSDPDDRIAIVARNGLRSIARRFEGFGLPESPSQAEKLAAQESWKQWLRNARPSARFIIQ